RTREWRRGFDQNVFLESGARGDAADVGRGSLRTERDHLHAQVATVQTTLDAQDALLDEEGPDANAVTQPVPDAKARPREKAAPMGGSFVAKARVPGRGTAWKPRGIALAAGLSAAVCLFAAARFLPHRAPPPAPGPVAARPVAAVPKAGSVIHDCPTCPVM